VQPVSRFEWERLIRRAVLPVRVKLVALVLSTYADPNGTRVRPGLESLAGDTGQSTSTVKRCVQALRDEYGLLLQVSRGGGRSGHGKATEYRLVFPEDLLERVDLVPLGRDSGVTQETSQSGSTRDAQPVDNSNPEVFQEDSHSVVPEVSQVTHENDFHGSGSGGSGRLRGQKPRLRAHLDDLLPTTRPSTQEDQHVEGSQGDLLPARKINVRRPKSCRRCEAWLDPDGSCFKCREAS